MLESSAKKTPETATFVVGAVKEEQSTWTSLSHDLIVNSKYNEFIQFNTKSNSPATTLKFSNTVQLSLMHEAHKHSTTLSTDPLRPMCNANLSTDVHSTKNEWDGCASNSNWLDHHE